MKHEGNGDEKTTRSGLFMEAVRIIKEMRKATNDIYPRFAIWENVPGAFSSNKGEDFRIVLEELIKISEPNATVPAPPKGRWPYADAYVGDGFSLSYRTFDAQYWGVPQRRRRIYLVADFAGGRAPRVLFEREGLRGYFAESGAPGQGAAANAEGGAGADDSQSTTFINTENSVFAVATQQGGAEITADGICPTVTAAAGMSGNNQPWICKPICCVDGDKIGKAERAGGSGLGVRDGDKMYTLTAKDAGTHAVAYGISSYDSNAMKASNPKSGIYEADTSRTLDLNGGNPACHQGGIAIVQPIAIDRAFFNQGKNAQYKPQLYTDGTVSTLVAKGPSAVAHYWDGGQTCGTLTANNAAGSQRMPDKENFNCVIERSKLTYIVRRLTPVECARLQGFADQWGHIEVKEALTDEEYRFWLEVRNTHAAINGKAVKDYTKEQMLKWYNKLHSKSAEYKMWGNGIALPTALYVMQGVSEALKGATNG